MSLIIKKHCINEFPKTQLEKFLTQTMSNRLNLTDTRQCTTSRDPQFLAAENVDDVQN